MTRTWDPDTWRCDRCDAFVAQAIRPYCLSHNEASTLPPGWEAWDVCEACARASASQADALTRLVEADGAAGGQGDLFGGHGENGR